MKWMTDLFNKLDEKPIPFEAIVIILLLLILWRVW